MRKLVLAIVLAGCANRGPQLPQTPPELMFHVEHGKISVDGAMKGEHAGKLGELKTKVELALGLLEAQ